jgi:hypothetical protein
VKGEDGKAYSGTLAILAAWAVLLEVAVLAAVLADGLAADVADWGGRVPFRGGNELADFSGGDGRVDLVVWERVGGDEGPVGQDEGVKGEDGLLDTHLDGCDCCLVCEKAGWENEIANACGGVW